MTLAKMVKDNEDKVSMPRTQSMALKSKDVKEEKKKKCC